MTRLHLLLLVLLGSFLAPSASLLLPGGLGLEIPLPSLKDHQIRLVDEVIRGPAGSPWVRIFFSQLELPLDTLMVLTSLEDGAQQHLDHRIVSQWQLSTAYFNGDSVQVQVFAGAQHPLLKSSPAVYQAAFGDALKGEEDVNVLRMKVGWIQNGMVRDEQKSICFSPDTRVFTNDTRQGRYIYGDPNGCCTAWLINDANHCFLSAGHCTEAGNGLVEFMVPMSAEDGTLVHPAPIHQYIVDQESMQTQYSGTADWRYFGVFSNSESGLHPVHAYSGEFYRLRSSEPVATNHLLRITGYGENESFPPSHRRVLKTATGSFGSISTGEISYRVDTTNGNSGSAVFDETTGVAIGIHTLGGCRIGASSSENSGVNILLPTLQTALKNPRGVCASGRT